MAFSVVIHILNEEPVLCEIEEMPDPTAQIIIVHNPRRRDGKDLHFLDENVTTMILPWHRVNLVQVMPATELEEVIGFVRE